MKSIVRIPQSVLQEIAAPVTRLDKKLQKLLAEMRATLLATHNPRGVGLAAPQVGESLRIFLARPTTKSPVRIFINPKILDSSQKTTDSLPDESNKLEGCLSIPAIWGKVVRSLTVKVEYQNEEGMKKTEAIDGFLAIIVQHEVDHLNGILFTQRVLEQKGKLYQTTRDRTGKEMLEEIDLM